MKLFRNLWAREAPPNSIARPFCNCLAPQEKGTKWTELRIHEEDQDTNCSGWLRLNDLIEQAAADGREEFSPGREMTPDEWAQITELPRSIGKLKSVKRLILYGSSLVRIPPEIGEMAALEEFVPYTSYRLHWFPFEITRCENLRGSTVSTRALYGNYNYRAPFPKLPQIHASLLPGECSVCQNSLVGLTPLQYWISLRVGSDILPLLVHACSEKCISDLPSPPQDYIAFPHRGGLGLAQPEPEW